MYKKPEIETMVLPEDAIMEDITLSGSGTMGEPSGAPSRATRAGDPY